MHGHHAGELLKRTVYVPQTESELKSSIGQELQRRWWRNDDDYDDDDDENEDDEDDDID